MKKSKPAKKPVKKSARKPALAAPASTVKEPLVIAQPQSKQVAAVQAGIFLHDDDSWSQAYFDSKDLHNLERELFG